MKYAREIKSLLNNDEYTKEEKLAIIRFLMDSQEDDLPEDNDMLDDYENNEDTSQPVDLISVAEAADRYGYSDKTFYNWMKNHPDELRTYAEHGRAMLSVTEINAYIVTHRPMLHRKHARRS